MLNSDILERIGQVVVEKPGQITGPLSKFIGSKKEWKPFPIAEKNEDIITERMGTHKCIQKCIALALALELPAGHLALEGTEQLKDNPYPDPQITSMALALESNAVDEDNHYKAFKLASIAYDMPIEYLDQIDDLRTKVLELGEHPVMMVGFLELTVFFPSLAMMRKWGNPSLKNLTNYVSKDESAHVNTNYHIVDTLGLKWKDFDAVDQLREDLIKWLTSDLVNVKENQNHWLKVSENLMDTRKSPELEWTKTAMQPAFFEMPNY